MAGERQINIGLNLRKHRELRGFIWICMDSYGFYMLGIFILIYQKVMMDSIRTLVSPTFMIRGTDLNTIHGHQYTMT